MPESEEFSRTVYTVTSEELVIIQAVKTAYDNAVAGGYIGTPLEWFQLITNPVLTP